MLLRHVGLGLSDEDFSCLSSDFAFRARYLCNYVERHLRPLKFRTDDFRAICVTGRKRPKDGCPIMFEAAAVAEVFFDRGRYEKLGPGKHHEFFIKMLTAGFNLCSENHRIPLDHLLKTIEEFRLGDCKNEWTHRKKLLRKAGLRATLLCNLDSERFVLTLRLDRKGINVFSEEILRTEPDEIIFAHKFKDVKLEGDTVVVLNRFDVPTYKVALSSLP